MAERLKNQAIRDRGLPCSLDGARKEFGVALIFVRIGSVDVKMRQQLNEATPYCGRGEIACPRIGLRNGGEARDQRLERRFKAALKDFTPGLICLLVKRCRPSADVRPQVGQNRFPDFWCCTALTWFMKS